MTFLVLAYVPGETLTARLEGVERGRGHVLRADKIGSMSAVASHGGAGGRPAAAYEDGAAATRFIGVSFIRRSRSANRRSSRSGSRNQYN